MNNNNKDKKDILFSNNNDNKNNQKPLYKIFMEQNKNNKKKLHLIKGNISESKDFQFQWKNCEGDKTIRKNLNLQLFSYKILEAMHNSTPEYYLKITLKNLIKKRKCHTLAYFNEISICTSTLRDYLKRFYTYKESKERIPKYVSYYKNYLLFFCRPFFINTLLNKQMVKHMEKVAQIFYNENYADEDEDKKKEKNEENIQIFNKKISEEIENCDVFTVVTSEAAMKQIQSINKKIIKNNEFKKIENNINKFDNKLMANHNNNIHFLNNLKSIEIEQSTILQNSYKITTIGEQKVNVKKKISFNMKKSNKDYINKEQPTNTLNIIINELDNNNNSNKKDNNINDNCLEKIKEIINNPKNNNNNIINEGKNLLNNINNNCIVIQGGKTTNNINIHINHLTIGHKYIAKNEKYNIINGLSDLNNCSSKNINNSKKIIKKLKNKEQNNSIKERNTNKKVNNYISSSIPQKLSIKDKNKNKNSSLTLPQPAQNMLSTITKKIAKICPSPNTINNYNNNYNQININNLKNKPLKETRNKSVFRGGYNSGYMTNLHNIKNNISNFSKSQQKFGRITINTNNTNYLKNVINNNMNINYGTTKMKKKNNIFYSKNILSGERGGRSTSNIQKRPKKVFSSILQFNGSNVQIFNLKNTIGNNSKNSENINIVSPIAKEKKNDIIPPIKKNENIYYKENNRGLKIKDYKLRGKQINLHKILNIPQSNKRTKSTG